MKKQLMTTSALVAAGVLAGTAFAGTAAAEGPEVTVGGFFYTAATYVDQDDNCTAAPATAQGGCGDRDFWIGTSGEVQVTGKTTLENGLTVAGRIEFEAQNQSGGSSIVDERWISFSGDFGTLKLGSDDSAAYAMHYQAPVGAWQIGINTPSFAAIDASVANAGFPTYGNAVTSYATTYPGMGSDGNKIIYFTPRIAGFQLGVSYQPDNSNGNGTASDLAGFTVSELAGGTAEILAAGANFQNSFDGFDVSASVGYATGSVEDITPTIPSTAEPEQISAGLTVGFAGFAVGGSFLNSDPDAPSGAPSGEYTTWELGATYSTGPWTVGVNYQQAEVEDACGISCDHELDAFLVSGTYSLGPGVDVWGGVKYMDYTSDLGVAEPGAENEALAIAIGTGISF